MKRLAFVGLVVLGLMAGALVVFGPLHVAAAPKDEICQGVGAVSTGGCDPAQGTSLNDIITLIIDIMSRIIGIIAVIMIAVAGYKFVSSGGDSSKVSSAKSTIIYALIGLVVVAMAQTLVWFVLQRTTETEEERKKREAAAKTTYLPTSPQYYTVEFNNKAVL